MSENKKDTEINKKSNPLHIIAIIIIGIIGAITLYYGAMFIGLIAFTTSDGKKSNREIIRYMDKNFDIDLKLIEKETVDDNYEIYHYRKRQDKNYTVKVEQRRSDTGMWELDYDMEEMLGDRLDNFKSDIKKIMGDKYSVNASYKNIYIKSEYTYEEIPQLAEELLKVPSYLKKNKKIFKMCEKVCVVLQNEDVVDFYMRQFDEQLKYENHYFSNDRNIYISEKIKDKNMLIDILKFRYMTSKSNNFSDVAALMDLPKEDVDKYMNDLDTYKEKYGEEERQEEN